MDSDQPKRIHLQDRQLHQRQIERNQEDDRIQKLGVKLQAKILQQQEALARAS